MPLLAPGKRPMSREVATAQCYWWYSTRLAETSSNVTAFGVFDQRQHQAKFRSSFLDTCRDHLRALTSIQVEGSIIALATPRLKYEHFRRTSHICSTLSTQTQSTGGV